VINLSKPSRVALLRVFMLHKQMSWLRTVMHDTFEAGIQNWCLPLNHMITGKHSGPEYASTVRGSRRMAGPFDAGLLSHAIGGNVRLYSSQMELLEFTTRLRDAQLLRREAILPTENGGYKLELAINEVIRVPSFYNENVMTDGETPHRLTS